MFAKKTTATVLASFQRTLEELRGVEQSHTAEAEQHRVQVQQSQAAHDAATAEASAARTVAARIEALLNTTDIG